MEQQRGRTWLKGLLTWPLGDHQRPARESGSGEAVDSELDEAVRMDSEEDERGRAV